MRLLSLEVTNYRNIASARLEPGRELTVICGNNGQGKTNLLEAIWLLTGGKSFRGGKDAELVRRGETFAVLEAVTQRTRQEDQEPDDPARVRITVGTPDAPRPGRYASVNGAAPKRAASLAGSFPAVVFDPGHLSLVKGAPEGRRRFLDAALCQLYPGYLATYRRYVRVLQQKNALLRHSATGQERPYAEKCALLEVLNVELAAPLRCGHVPGWGCRPPRNRTGRRWRGSSFPGTLAQRRSSPGFPAHPRAAAPSDGDGQQPAWSDQSPSARCHAAPVGSAVPCAGGIPR